jgi:hypothetical protein
MGHPLVAFALVAEEYEKTGDPVRGLKPLFAPLLAGMQGQVFDPAAFAAAFTSAYGLAMSAFVAKALSDRLVGIGLLEATEHERFVVSSEEQGNYEFDENEIDETVKIFVRWASKEVDRLARSIDENALEDAFLSRLARPGFASIFLEEDSGARSQRLKVMLGVGGVDPNAASEEFLDYLVSRFILTASSDAPEVFDAIASIAYGSLVADAVAGLAVPGAGDMPDPPATCRA